MCTSWRHIEEKRFSFCHHYLWNLMGVSGQLHAAAAVPSGKDPSPRCPWLGDWVGNSRCERLWEEKILLIRNWVRITVAVVPGLRDWKCLQLECQLCVTLGTACDFLTVVSPILVSVANFFFIYWNILCQALTASRRMWQPWLANVQYPPAVSCGAPAAMSGVKVILNQGDVM